MRLRVLLASTLAPALILGAALVAPGPAPAQETPQGTAQGTAQGMPQGGAAQGATPAPAALPGTEALVAHRGAYRLSFDRARDNSDVARAEGAMVFEVLDACDGWASRQRLTMRLQDRDGQVVETASDYSTWESKDGLRLRFSLTQMTGGAVSNRVTGEATLRPDGSGTARYDQPRPSQEALPPGTLLPTAHTLRAIAAARAGERILNVPLMDGTSDDGSQESTTVLSPWQRGPGGEARFPLLANQESGRMRIAFFGKDSNGGGAASPDYEVGLRYYANGVADELNMDFGEFAVNGRLESLEALPGGC